MEINYVGDSSFLLKGERAVAINPYSASESHIKLYSSRRMKGKLIVNGPGEYEIGNVLIVTVCIDRASGSLVHAVTLDNLTVVHVHDTSRSLTPGELLVIGPVDVLLMNSDGANAAQSFISAISPRVTVPYGERVAELCTMLGASNPQPQTKFAWNGLSAAPKVVLLKPVQAKKKAA